MMCAKPFRRAGLEHGCGQCKPCRLNRKRLWTGRLMLELQKHRAALFVTLTYDKEHLPCDLSVSVRDAQLFLKRLRAAMYPRTVRYYIVGEYGDRSGRPHYHALLFGDSFTMSEISSSWPYGRVHVGTLTPQSASYVVSYVVKGMTRKEDARLQGRFPEFARMSLKPGIGAPAIKEIGAAVMKGGLDYVVATGDVPGVVRAEGKKWPLGRYLRRKLREEIGMEASAPQDVVASVARSLQVEVRDEEKCSLRESKRLQDERRARGFVRDVNLKKEL